MASRASDVMLVALPQQITAVADALRLIPLFETSRDLQNDQPALRGWPDLPSGHGPAAGVYRVGAGDLVFARIGLRPPG